MTLKKLPPFALAGLCALAGAAHAVGPTGPVGPVGPNAGATTGASGSATTTTVIDNPGSGSNRIEITGNTARNITVHCGDASSARGQAGSRSVNSVNVDGRALQGRTVIVQGRNAQDIDARVDCGANAQGHPGHVSRGAANVNSVNIR